MKKGKMIPVLSGILLVVTALILLRVSGRIFSEQAGYLVTFEQNENLTVSISHAAAANEARFRLNPEKGFVITEVTAEPRQNYGILEGPDDAGFYSLREMSGDVSVSMKTEEAETAQGAAKAEEAGTAAYNELGKGTVWRYLDDGTDPADGNEDRTVWTMEKYDDSEWKRASGSFGAKDGDLAQIDEDHTADNVLEGCDGENNVPAYFFRTTLKVSSLEGFNALTGSVIYDDGIIIYLNGQRIAAGNDIARDENGKDLGTGIDKNLQYGGGSGRINSLDIKLLDLSALHIGDNTIAVEVHNGRKNSSDVWFSLPELKLQYIEPRTDSQSSVSLTLGADQSQMNFTWHCEDPSEGTLLIAEYDKLTDGKMPEISSVFEAEETFADENEYYVNQSTVSGLLPDTKYAYQLVNGINAGKVMSFTTGGDEDSFSFVFAGDPQMGAGGLEKDRENWSDTLNIIADDEAFEGVDFIVSAGDQVDSDGNEEQYSALLEHDLMSSLPFVPAIGNHDGNTKAHSRHFNLPNPSQYGVTEAGSDYYFTYDNAMFMVLNSNDRNSDGHKRFMEQAIADTRNQEIRWKIVVLHHSLYSMADHADSENILERRQELAPIFNELNIDAVLMGHDHAYCRTYIMDGLIPVTDQAAYGGEGYFSAENPAGILYITANSSTGSKFYDLSEERYDYAAVTNQEEVPNVSRVDVSDSEFTVTTYRTTDMSVVDHFTIYKTE